MPAAKDADDTDPVRVNGATPVLGVTASHCPPVAVAAVALTPRAPLPPLLTWTVCGAGLVPRSVTNESDVADSAIEGGAVTVKVTAIVCDALAPGTLIVIAPV